MDELLNVKKTQYPITISRYKPMAYLNLMKVAIKNKDLKLVQKVSSDLLANSQFLENDYCNFLMDTRDELESSDVISDFNQFTSNLIFLIMSKRVAELLSNASKKITSNFFLPAIEIIFEAYEISCKLNLEALLNRVLSLFLQIKSEISSGSLTNNIINQLENCLISIEKQKELSLSYLKIYQLVQSSRENGDFESACLDLIKLQEFLNQNESNLFNERTLLISKQVMKSKRNISTNAIEALEKSAPGVTTRVDSNDHLKASKILLKMEFYPESVEHIDLVYAFAEAKRSQNSPLLAFSIDACVVSENVNFLTAVAANFDLYIFSFNDQRKSRMQNKLCNAFYKLGLIDQINDFLSIHQLFGKTSLKFWECMAKNDIAGAMDFRAFSLAEAFCIFYKDNKIKQFLNDIALKIPSLMSWRNLKDVGPVVFPEKDLCGDIFNIPFVKTLSLEEANLSYVIDQRLLKMAQNYCPEVNFIPKSPKNKFANFPEMFQGVSYKLAGWLCGSSKVKIEGRRFKRIQISKFENHPVINIARKEGWFEAVSLNEVEKYEIEKLLDKDKVNVCFSSGSATKTSLRNIHTLPLDEYPEILEDNRFNFINIDPSLDLDLVQEFNAEFDLKVIQPNFSLFDDLEKLVYLLSICDLAIIPPNNLMDLCSSVGVRSLVPNPSNNMIFFRKENKHYFYSENVDILVSLDGDETLLELIMSWLDRNHQILSAQFKLKKIPT